MLLPGGDSAKGKEWPQILAICSGCLCSFTTGMLTSWTSPYIINITEDKENYDITEDDTSLFPVIPPFFMMVSIPIFSKLADIIGRKKTILISAFPYFTCWLLMALAKDVWLFYIARAFEGVSDSIVFGVLPMYLGEVATPKVRGVWGNGMTLMNYFGEFLINIIGIKCSVQQASYIGMTIPILFLITFVIMPESPYFLLMKQRDVEAMTSLQWLRRKINIEDDFKQLQSDVKRQMSEQGTWKELFTISANRKALLAGMFLRISQQFSGLSVYYSYTKLIFVESRTTVSPDMSILIFTGLNFSLNIVASYTSHFLGRKKSQIYSLLLCSFALAPFTAYLYILHFHPDADLSNWRWVPLACMSGYIIFSAFGVAIIPSLMLGELFSASIKAKGLTVLIMQLGALLFSVNYLFYYLKSTYGMYAPFMLFTICSLVSSGLAVYLVPETEGKTLEEIQQGLKKNKENS
ncbi:unnamed protein product [Acanthoscelides obtectus]|uniref:Major facilitator superfamily (MFS) profile domain-containing protein n=1 Tax=Acanthoscelides obtectus TaxID=200917 RepID=A0A9P0MK78_ACAOB|nr:unnamed protein product [Acanthoscelides obtectus]CAH2015722.1 unnamed protein product [Acanthoscelides obtectus]CAK1647888.1 Facilitated trehalose transporter Tret1-2 homolog [Acanthoscelides obtectus]CAK1686512.1 Facilitated trehalose transporter Tret1-2 homolog [Acanthoscelides obtectus]